MSISALDYHYCAKHDLIYDRPTCRRCAAASVCAQTAPDATALRLTTLSKTIDYLLRRQSDLELEMTVLRQRIIDLEHGRIATQRAHNVLAGHVEQLEDAHNRLVVYAESIEADRE